METAKLRFGLEEKIGLPDFSNIVVGPISIERSCEDTKEERARVMAEMIEEVEEILAQERTKVLDWLKENK
jgi:hypothetical protein